MALTNGTGITDRLTAQQSQGDPNERGEPGLAQLLDEVHKVLANHDSPCGQACAAAIAGLSASALPALPEEPGETVTQPFYSSLMAALAKASHPLGKALHHCSPRLPWAPTRNEAIPPEVAAQLAVVHFIGPDAIIPHDTVRVGFYLQSPGYHYPAHSHAAEELYFILSGHAHWQVADGPNQVLPPESYSHHRAWDSHAMTTGDEALTAIWAWSGDISFETYKMD
ncbi:dimethylsulfonioproprionate lyase family protein [Rhodovibrionaceae bacterium A322]